MSLQTRMRAVDRELDEMFKTLRKMLEEKTELDEPRKLVNSLLPVQKDKLLQRFLSRQQNLNEEIRMKCLLIFLDKNTKYICFEQYATNQTILEIISKKCPNIENVDFRGLTIEPRSKDNFKLFLKKSTQLKSLRVKCKGEDYPCALYQLLLEEEFDLHEPDVKNGLLKIEYIAAASLTRPECARLLKLLPNLKGLGIGLFFSYELPYYINDDVLVKKLSNMTEFGDAQTTLVSLESFSKYCPKTTRIHLMSPEPNVVENLGKFPLLSDVTISSLEPDFLFELIMLLQSIGKQMRNLRLMIPNEIELDSKILVDLCPELVQLDITRIRSSNSNSDLVD